MSSRDAKRPKQPPGARSVVGLLVGCLLVGGLVGLAASLLEGVPGALGFWLTVLVIGSGLCAAMVGAVIWWQSIDEAAQEAHKWAWWWGGTGGIAVGGVLLLTLSFRKDTGYDALDVAPTDLLALGMMLILMFQLVGYTIAWASWWLRHR